MQKYPVEQVQPSDLTAHARASMGEPGDFGGRYGIMTNSSDDTMMSASFSGMLTLGEEYGRLAAAPNMDLPFFEPVGESDLKTLNVA